MLRIHEDRQSSGHTPENRWLAADVHAHYVSPEVLKVDDRITLKNREDGEVGLHFDGRYLGPFTPKLSQLEQVVADMDRKSISHRLICTASWLTYYWIDAASAQAIHRASNELLAAAAAQEPDRLLGLASVPLQDVALATKELEHAVTQLGLVGAAIGTNVNGHYFDEQQFDQFFAAAEALGVPLFFHPDNVAGLDALGSYALQWLIGNPHEATLSLSRLLLGGVLERHPKLRICFPLGGGYLPYVIGRLDHGWRVRPDARTRATRAPSSFLDQCYFDTVVHSPDALRFLLSVVSPDRVILGSDYPWDMGVADPKGMVDSMADVPERVRQSILTDNVQRLIGRRPVRLSVVDNLEG